MNRGDAPENINFKPRQGRKKMPAHRFCRPYGIRHRDPRETQPMRLSFYPYRRQSAEKECPNSDLAVINR